MAHTDARKPCLWCTSGQRDLALPNFFTPRQIIEILNCSRSVVYELIASGQIPSLRIGRTLRVPTADFLAWVNRNMRHPAA